MSFGTRLLDVRGHSDVKRNHSNIQEGFLSKREVWEKFKRYGWLNSTDSKSFSKIKCLCVRCSKPLEQNHSLHFRSMVAYYSNFFYFHQKPIFSTIWFPLKQCSIVNYSLTSALGKHSLNSVILSLTNSVPYKSTLKHKQQSSQTWLYYERQ